MEKIHKKPANINANGILNNCARKPPINGPANIPNDIEEFNKPIPLPLSSIDVASAAIEFALVKKKEYTGIAYIIAKIIIFWVIPRAIQIHM